MAFKDLFIKAGEGASNESTSNPTVSGTPKSYTANVKMVENSVPQPTVEVQPTMRPSSITADDVIVNKIWDKIIEANRPGPDYLELKNNVEALEDLPISNEQKLMSAFKVLKKGYPNFQKDDIVKAIDFYLKVVNDEKNEGMKQLESIKKTSVDSVENEIKSMQLKAEELKQQYDELQTNIGEKTLELTKAKNDIEVKYNSFVGSVDAVIDVLNNDKNNIIAINF